MPESAIRNVAVDHVLPVDAIPGLLSRLVCDPMPTGVRVMASPNDRHPDVAQSGQAQLLSGRERGPPTNITCPECGGALWELSHHSLALYQCHVGHSFTEESLLESKSSELEGALWGALRALEESVELRRRMAARLSAAPLPLRDMQRDYERQAGEAEARAAVLRTVLGDAPAAERLARSTIVESEAAEAEGYETMHDEGSAD
jgi:two-component system, chemotaxis family, protein-glutamate methylesterase/glutaminase